MNVWVHWMEVISDIKQLLIILLLCFEAQSICIFLLVAYMLLSVDIDL